MAETTSGTEDPIQRLFQRGLSHRDAGRFDLAARDLRTVVERASFEKLKSLHREAQRRLAGVLWRQHHFDAAYIEFLRALDLVYPDMDEYWAVEVQLAQCEIFVRRFSDARERLNRVKRHLDRHPIGLRFSKQIESTQINVGAHLLAAEGIKYGEAVALVADRARLLGQSTDAFDFNHNAGLWSALAFDADRAEINSLQNAAHFLEMAQSCLGPQPEGATPNPYVYEIQLGEIFVELIRLKWSPEPMAKDLFEGLVARLATIPLEDPSGSPWLIGVERSLLERVCFHRLNAVADRRRINGRLQMLRQRLGVQFDRWVQVDLSARFSWELRPLEPLVRESPLSATLLS